MSPTRFCIAFLGACLAIAAAVAALNVAVDPYLLFDRPRLAGFNAVKPAVETREHLIKAYAAPRSAARTLIFGSSRTDIGLDPSHPLWRAGDSPVYNLSLVGSDARTLVRYLQHVVALRPPAEAPRTIVVGLDFETFLFRPAAPAPSGAAPIPPSAADEIEERLAVLADGRPNPARVWRIVKDYATAALSLDALVDSIATIAANRSSGGANIKLHGHLTEAKLQQTVAVDGAAALFAQKNAQTVRQYAAPRQVLSEIPGGPIDRLSAVRKFIEIAKAHGMSVIFFIQPAHADRLELFDRMGYWEDYERWKRALADLAAAAKGTGADVTLWDFGGYEVFAQERIPAGNDRTTRLRWFWDPVHYTTALGEIMLARILRRPGAVLYGTELTPENVDARLAEIRRDREIYRAREPGEAQRRAALFCGMADCGKYLLSLGPSAP